MIEELTQSQLDSMPEFVRKYVGIGLSTDRINRPEGIAYAKKLYAMLGRRPPEAVVFMDGPVHSWLAVCILHADGGAQARSLADVGA